MATGLKGMNIEQGRSLAKSSANDSQQIEQIKSTLTSQLANTEWIGPDRDAFQGAWESDYAPALQKVATALQEASLHLNKEADAQEQASSS